MKKIAILFSASAILCFLCVINYSNAPKEASGSSNSTYTAPVDNGNSGESQSTSDSDIALDDSVFTYEINGYNEVIITGLNDFEGGSLVIPSTLNGLPVTVIGDKAFKSRDEITSVIISDSITDIGREVFANCQNLENARIGNGATFVGYWMFQGCPKLAAVHIGDNVTLVGHGAFMLCESLETITLGKKVARIRGEIVNS